MKRLLPLLLIVIAIYDIDGRIYKRCELARELLRYHVPRDELPTWLCIARYESKYNSSAIGRLNGNWSNDYGLFQVSDRYWCVSSPQRKSANLCQMDCRRLLNDDLRETLKCAQRVRQLQGWKAWAAYNGICKRMERLQTEEEAGCL